MATVLRRKHFICTICDSKVLLVICMLFLSFSASAQNEFFDVVTRYFRVDPYEGRFPTFVKTLSNDPELFDKQLRLKSDTNYFSLSGTYKNFNPFSVNASLVKVFLNEQELTTGDSVKQNFTVYNYQILAFIDDNEAVRRRILKEFDKLGKNIQKVYTLKEENDLQGFQGIKDGKICNYYWDQVPLISPVTISWQTINQKKQIAITILIKMFIDKGGYARPVGGIR